jgi:glycosyltransferase involved in cell wall biosynthesis
MRGAGAARLLPTTEALRTYLAQRYRVRLEPPAAIVSPNGVDLERYSELPSAQVARAELGLQESLTVGYTGHLYPGRGVEVMFELARMNPAIQFVWAGGEPAAIERWRTRLRDANLGNVLLKGFISNDRLPLFQAASDILMMPYARRISVSSGGDTARFANPMKVFEYLASGRAIISSDLPILREILNDTNAFLVPPEDVHAWDQALKTLASDSALRDRLAAQSLRDARQYSWQKRAQRALSGLEV